MKPAIDFPALLEADRRFRELCPNRKQALFTEFLPTGHALMTLGCVPEHMRREVVLIKSLLGMHITLYDDMADNPHLADEAVLAEIYKIPFNKNWLDTAHLHDHGQKLVALALYLANEMMARIEKLPWYPSLRQIFEFDFKQFYNCNQYYSLALKNMSVMNSWEIRHLGPFNMGMIIAGTIDIMASPAFDVTELGRTRIILSLAQRFGYLCNNITTLVREMAEQTYTNEVIIVSKENGAITDLDLHGNCGQLVLDKISPALDSLKGEQESILQELKNHLRRVKSFDSEQYINNLVQLRSLHEQFFGII